VDEDGRVADPEALAHFLRTLDPPAAQIFLQNLLDRQSRISKPKISHPAPQIVETAPPTLSSAIQQINRPAASEISPSPSRSSNSTLVDVSQILKANEEATGDAASRDADAFVLQTQLKLLSGRGLQREKAEAIRQTVDLREDANPPSGLQTFSSSTIIPDNRDQHTSLHPLSHPGHSESHASPYKGRTLSSDSLDPELPVRALKPTPHPNAPRISVNAFYHGIATVPLRSPEAIMAPRSPSTMGGSSIAEPDDRNDKPPIIATHKNESMASLQILSTLLRVIASLASRHLIYLPHISIRLSPQSQYRNLVLEPVDFRHR
jgi:hypothetical protein